MQQYPKHKPAQPTNTTVVVLTLWSPDDGASHPKGGDVMNGVFVDC